MRYAALEKTLKGTFEHGNAFGKNGSNCFLKTKLFFLTTTNFLSNAVFIAFQLLLFEFKRRNFFVFLFFV